MVGVTGGSKACNTCKKRKIAVGLAFSFILEKPECSICRKSNRVCGGYTRERIFILDKRSKKAASTQAVSKPATKEKIEVEIPVQKEEEERPELLFEACFQPRQISRRNPIEGSIVTRKAYSSIWHVSPSNRAIYRQQILEEFLFVYMPPPQPSFIPLGKNSHHSGSWLSMIPSLPNITTALEASILAVCTAKLGRINNDSHLVRESLKFYIQGLWELQKALWNPRLMYRDETLAACMALMIYEVIECPDQNIEGWSNHINGCRRLFELRGPKAYRSDFGHQLFLSFRHIEIQQSLAERRSTFFSKPEWMHLPWKGYQKPLSAELHDILACMTGVMELGYRILGDPTCLLSPTLLIPALQEILTSIWTLDAQLTDFYQKFEAETPSPIYWACPSRDPIFPVAFHFPDPKTAHTCMLYWTTLSILWSGMAYLYKFLERLAQELESAQRKVTEAGSPSPSPSSPSPELEEESSPLTAHLSPPSTQPTLRPLTPPLSPTPRTPQRRRHPSKKTSANP
ncbi:hypothetical protein G7Y89_g5055 [Cudoniella acicularis]|uniref:Zn(2)-C6 fungal-type domain-containing protein n=1 Tax=Cudoniella acicularis TaxID=354080 RepID=A0A8H4W455_9HELO|nr:hypothetical protein G7Y89_g5055 [Cudoniella acicularis]